MVPLQINRRPLFPLLLLPLLFLTPPASAASAQAVAPAPADRPTVTDSNQPLPSIDALMREVEAHQKALEKLRQEYIYTSTVTEVKLDSHGNARKTETIESETFYLDSLRIERVTRRDGRVLTPDEQRKEAERVDKEISKAKSRRDKGETDGEGHRYTVTLARMLELGSFSNERRVTLHGRSTIALDYTGNSKAKTANPLEAAIHELAGTIWVDEGDRALSRIEGHFVNNFKVGGGLLADIAKGTSFAAESTRVNGEVWLPAAFSAQGSAHALLFFSFNGRVSGTSTNYRRFKTGSRIMPELNVLDTPSTGAPESPVHDPAKAPTL